MRSPAVERAIVRGLDEGSIQRAIETAVQRAMASDEVADTVVRALDSEVADRVWREILAGPKAQMLVERIAEAPEVRAAITEQGVGLVTDLGRRLTKVTEALDDALEDVLHRARGQAAVEEEHREVGLATRFVAAAVDLGLFAGALSIGSGLLASVVPFVFGRGDGISVLGAAGLVALWVGLGGALLVGFWGLVGQTPGMRLLSIHVETEGSRELGVRTALRRVLALPLSVAPAGLGLFAILTSPQRLAWHDRIAGTRVVYDPHRNEAPWSTLGENPQRAGTNRRSQKRVGGGT